jgi:hypothetical protein
MQFKAILETLGSWSDFDSFFFRNNSLDKKQAQINIAKIRELQRQRDFKIKDFRAKREAEEKINQQPRQSLVALKSDFFSLFIPSCTPQQRGYRLEKILIELAKLAELEITEPFKIVGEQIDGAIKYDGEHYLLEAKWHDQAASNEALYQFAYKVDGKMYGRGIFVSMNGFSPEVVKGITAGKSIMTVLVDGSDLVAVFEEHISFQSMLDKKIKAAQTRGQIYIDVLSGKPRVPHGTSSEMTQTP